MRLHSFGHERQSATIVCTERRLEGSKPPALQQLPIDSACGSRAGKNQRGTEGHQPSPRHQPHSSLTTGSGERVRACPSPRAPPAPLAPAPEPPALLAPAPGARLPQIMGHDLAALRCLQSWLWGLRWLGGGRAEGLCPPTPAFGAPCGNPWPEVPGEAGCGFAATLPSSAAWGSSADWLY